ncbi:tocopherol cyclase family protein [Jeotgalibaca caeni]|uniref:tocopherol cyclase family protein n=1 Tax=Jeotgalibaca caeni TaxID=3028623 RepID=UPI00237D9CE6|nr:tocopherol cyclase family protein [Jeotgalibaca caeni]MDE1549749.1 tocopherol cyclase family protein [Jeotgalibaca caeni]
MKGALNFQGNLKKRRYFEGWYYKQVSFDEKRAISFIPGMTLNEKDSHSFVQYIYVEQNENGKPITKTGYIRYPLESFIWNDDPFTVKIGENLFSESLISIHLEDENLKIDGNLQLGTFTSIKRTPYMPTIMGPFGYVPKMECYHEVISMSHLLKGELQIGDHQVDFTGGKGYIEKDWGSNFPKQYVWLQSNHFENPHTSLFFSDAHIPFYGREFQGHICTFSYGGKEYRFATYLNSTLEVTFPREHEVQATLENDKVKLELHASFSDQGNLIAPVPSGMEKAIKEGIAGEIAVTFYNKKTKETYSDVGKMAGIEIVD